MTVARPTKSEAKVRKLDFKKGDDDMSLTVDVDETPTPAVLSSFDSLGSEAVCGRLREPLLTAESADCW